MKDNPTELQQALQQLGNPSPRELAAILNTLFKIDALVARPMSRATLFEKLRIAVR